MKPSELKKRLRADRPASVVGVRMPDDVIDDLKRVAAFLNLPGVEALIGHYVGKCLREDLERLETLPTHAFIDSLKRHGVPETVINEAIAEVV